MIAAIVLAAGGASRLGRPKQLVVSDGETLIHRATRSALDAGCEPVVVVVGAHADRVTRELALLPVEIAHNPDWRDGMSRSIAAGVEFLQGDRRDPEALILLPCDQPRISGEVLRRLAETFDGCPGTRVGCEYAGTLGTPALFERSLFPELLELRGDRGAKSLLATSTGRVLRIAWPDGSVEINRPEDLPSR